MKRNTMRLKVLLPSDTLLDEQVCKVVAEAENGAFCLLPRHADFVTALVPGLFFFTSVDGQGHCLAVAEGCLVKCGSDVSVSVRDAVQGNDLESLRQTIEQRFSYLDEQEKTARSALARLEAGVMRRFVELR